jgi:hypothetical protein
MANLAFDIGCIIFILFDSWEKIMSKSGKGSGFERDISKQLSLWWSGGERDDLMWRTSQSGGRATQRAKQAVRTKYGYGDLTFTDPIAKPLFDLLVISAKRGYTHTSRPLSKEMLNNFCNKVGKSASYLRKETSKLFSKTKKAGGIDLLDFIDRPKKKNVLDSWIKECYRDRELASVTYWLLIFRRDGAEACCVMPEEFHKELAKDIRMTIKEFGACSLTFTNSIGSQNRLVSLADFLNWCNPKHIINLAEHYKSHFYRVE